MLLSSGTPLISDATVTQAKASITAGKDRVSITGAPVSFSAQSRTSTPMSDGYHWNFGDGKIAQGELVAHTYTHAGSYRVTLTSGEAQDELTVVVVSPSFLLSTEGDTLTLKNKTTRGIDISGWRIESGSSVFTLPLGSKINRNASVSYSKDTLGFAPAHTVLKTSEGVLITQSTVEGSAQIAKSGASKKTTKALTSKVSKTPKTKKTKKTKSGSRKVRNAEAVVLRPLSELAAADTAVEDIPESTGKSADSVPEPLSEKKPDNTLLYASAAVVILTAGAVASARRLKKDEWTIVEEPSSVEES